MSPNGVEAKAVLRAAIAESDATDVEFHAAMLGVLSTMLDAEQWAEATALTARALHGRWGRLLRASE